MHLRVLTCTLVHLSAPMCVYCNAHILGFRVSNAPCRTKTEFYWGLVKLLGVVVIQLALPLLVATQLWLVVVLQLGFG